MYLKKINIKNYFSIDNEGILLENLQNHPEIYFAGENGVGKTILLQAIARAVKGQQSIGTVIDVLEQNKSKAEAIFEAETEQSVAFFAYGINRLSIKGLEEIDFRKEEVYISLFDNSRNLTNPVYWLQMLELDRKHGKKTIEPEAEQELLSDLLDKDVRIRFDGSEVIFSEKGTDDLSFEQLSDGYKSTITWIADLLARLSFKQPEVRKLSEYKAIVCVDEIGIFLHPALQFDVVKKLRSKFTGIQWIFTTHSPMVMLGASADAITYKIYKDNGKTRISEPLELKNYTANSLITSPIWGMDKFYMQNTKPEFISDIDDIYQKIYDAVQKERKSKPYMSDNDLVHLIEQNLNEPQTNYQNSETEEPTYYLLNSKIFTREQSIDFSYPDSKLLLDEENISVLKKLKKEDKIFFLNFDSRLIVSRILIDFPLKIQQYTLGVFAINCKHDRFLGKSVSFKALTDVSIKKYDKNELLIEIDKQEYDWIIKETFDINLMF